MVNKTWFSKVCYEDKFLSGDKNCLSSSFPGTGEKGMLTNENLHYICKGKCVFCFQTRSERAKAKCFQLKTNLISKWHFLGDIL